MIYDIALFVDQVPISIDWSTILIDTAIGPDIKFAHDIFRIIILLELPYDIVDLK
jgi:hypothetical protein